MRRFNSAAARQGADIGIAPRLVVVKPLRAAGSIRLRMAERLPSPRESCRHEACREAVAPQHRSLGDVDSVEALAEYQAGKRAYKAQLRAAGMDGERPRPDSKRGPAPG